MQTESQEYMDTYLVDAGRTAAVPDENTIRTDAFPTHTHFAYDLNMFTESGVNADLVKRSLFYKEPLEKTRERGREAALKAKARYDVLQVAKLVKEDKIKFTPQQIDIIHACMGMISETGEILEEVLNSAIEGREMDLTNLEEEGGDVMWYVAMYLRAIGSNFIKVCKQNIAKLFKRYPEKFNSESALERDLSGERETLEQN